MVKKKSSGKQPKKALKRLMNQDSITKKSKNLHKARKQNTKGLCKVYENVRQAVKKLAGDLERHVAKRPADPLPVRYFNYLK